MIYLQSLSHKFKVAEYILQTNCKTSWMDDITLIPSKEKIHFPSRVTHPVDNLDVWKMDKWEFGHESKFLE